MKYSVVIPVYKNEQSIPDLLAALESLNESLQGQLEAVFVVDGSPDNSYSLLFSALDKMGFPAQLIVHSRNFGSFPAIRTGLLEARGKYFAVMAADLQEPPWLMQTFFQALDADECDVVVGTRNSRTDPLFTRLSSNLFWGVYRRLVVTEMPAGGVDVFACNTAFRDKLVELEESRSSLIALIFWLGFRRKTVGYDRQSRSRGQSAWTVRKRVEYMMDSVFAFTDYPIKLLLRFGLVGSVFLILLAIIVVAASLSGTIEVPGYAALMLAILLIGSLNMFGLGLVGTYAWRAYENSKQRPLAVVALKHMTEKYDSTSD